MKQKRIVAVLMALALILGMGMSALAAGEDATITVNNVGDKTVLDLYQILSYDVNAEGNYSNVQFVNAAYKAAFIAAIGATNLSQDPSVTEIMLWITNNVNNSAFAKALGVELQTLIDTQGSGITAKASKADNDVATNGTWLFENLDFGYYLILDRTLADSGNPNDYLANVIVLNVDSTTNAVNLKSSEKTIPVKSADDSSYSIGDTVNFTVEVVIPAFDMSAAGNTYTVTDTMGTGLTFAQADLDVLAITIGGIDIGTGTGEIDDVTYGEALNTAGFTLTFGSATDNTAGGLANYVGKTMVITYSATVNAAATENGIINTINTNGTTGEETVYTYGIKVKKIDEYGNALAGVTFNLYAGAEPEFDADGDLISTSTLLTFTEQVDGEDGAYFYGGTIADLVTGANGRLVIWGLKAGTYWLVETDTLAGYNLLAGAVEIEIVPDVDFPRLVESGLGGETNTAYLELTVINYTGIEMPSTGGIGTTLFAIVGIAIILGGCTLLIVNRKKVFGK